ncbi:hypothetical protein BC628DRAFT_541825 [Trametes gibbosa]|nr:hypothetical protein BC628DRAFT_541825 [Trametes gibbosa]
MSAAEKAAFRCVVRLRCAAFSPPTYVASVQPASPVPLACCIPCRTRPRNVSSQLDCKVRHEHSGSAAPNDFPCNHIETPWAPGSPSLMNYSLTEPPVVPALRRREVLCHFLWERCSDVLLMPLSSPRCIRAGSSHKGSTSIRLSSLPSRIPGQGDLHRQDPLQTHETVRLVLHRSTPSGEDGAPPSPPPREAFPPGRPAPHTPRASGECFYPRGQIMPLLERGMAVTPR